MNTRSTATPLKPLLLCLLCLCLHGWADGAADRGGLFTDTKHIIISFDTSASMGGFDHARIRRYLNKLLFEGIGNADIAPTDGLGLMEPVEERRQLFSKPLYAKGDTVTVLRQSDQREPTVKVLTSCTPADLAGQYPRAFGGRTDIAGMVAEACDRIPKETMGFVRTYWIFVSDNQPTVGAKHDRQGANSRLNQLGKTYSWDSLATIAVIRKPFIGSEKTAFVDVRCLMRRADAKRISQEVKERIAWCTEELAEIARQLAGHPDDEELLKRLARLQQHLRGFAKELGASSFETAAAYLEEVKSLLRATQLAMSVRLRSPADLADLVCQPDGRLAVDFVWEITEHAGVLGDGLSFALECTDDRGRPVGEPIDCKGATKCRLELAPGAYRWRVATRTAAGQSILSGFRWFQIHPRLGAPKLLRPSEGAQIDIGRPLPIEWEAAAGAHGYVVRITSRSTNVRVADKAVLDTAYTWEQANAPGDYSVEVYATAPPNQRSVAAVRNVTIRPPDLPAPTQLSPWDGAELAPGDVKFSWSRGGKAVAYDLSIAQVGGKPTVKRVDQTSATLALTADGVYRWTVCPVDAAGVKGQTSPSMVVVIKRAAAPPPAVRPAPPPPADLGPANGAVFTVQPGETAGTVTLSWTRVPHADVYRVHLKEPGGDEQQLSPGNGGKATSVKFNPSAAGDYYWRVEALQTNGDGTAMSSPFRFRVTFAPYPRPVLQAPVDRDDRLLAGGDALKVSFSWTPCPQAVKHSLLLSFGNTPAVAHAATSPSTATVTISRPGDYYWQVAAMLPNGSTIISQESRRLVIHALGTPELTAPAARADVRVGPCDFGWKPAAGAFSYRLALTDPEGNQTWHGPTNDVQLTVGLPHPGAYRWLVEAADQTGHRSTSGPRELIVSGVEPPTPIRPWRDDSIAKGKVRFRWLNEGIPCAVTVRIWRHDGDGEEDWVEVAKEELPEGTRQFETVLAQPGQYRWVVETATETPLAMKDGPIPFTIREPTSPLAFAFFLLLVFLIALGVFLLRPWQVAIWREGERPEGEPVMHRLGAFGSSSRIYLGPPDGLPEYAYVDQGLPECSVRRGLSRMWLFRRDDRICPIMSGEAFEVIDESGDRAYFVVARSGAEKRSRLADDLPLTIPTDGDHLEAASESDRFSPQIDGGQQSSRDDGPPKEDW
jgi:hypothetical protein